MKKEDLFKKLVETIDGIKSEYDVEIIKDFETKPLVNIHTIEEIGIGVFLKLNTKYDYDLEMLTEWKDRFFADICYVDVKSNQLWAVFKVHYDKLDKI